MVVVITLSYTVTAGLAIDTISSCVDLKAAQLQHELHWEYEKRCQQPDMLYNDKRSTLLSEHADFDNWHKVTAS